MAKALDGIRVIDLTVWFQGPVCAQHLADFGAEVIKVERPVHGDQARGVQSIKALPVGTWNQYFLVINRNKKSLALDLKRPAGREVLYRLVEKSDVFLSNLGMDTLSAWDLGWEKLSSINPRLVYATNTGYGHRAATRKPAFDMTVQALTGLMPRLGEPGEPPIYLGMGSGDAFGGLLSALGILVALHQRRATGRGQLVDASLYGAQLFLGAPSLQGFLAGESQQAEQRSRRGATSGCSCVSRTPTSVSRAYASASRSRSSSPTRASRAPRRARSSGTSSWPRSTRSSLAATPTSGWSASGARTSPRAGSPPSPISRAIRRSGRTTTCSARTATRPVRRSSCVGSPSRSARRRVRSSRSDPSSARTRSCCSRTCSVSTGTGSES